MLYPPYYLLSPTTTITMSDSEEEIVLTPQIPKKQKKRRNRKKKNHSVNGDECVVCYNTICRDLSAYKEDPIDLPEGITPPMPEKAVTCNENHKVCFDCATNMIVACALIPDETGCNGGDECDTLVYKCPVCRGLKVVRPVLFSCIHSNSYVPFYRFMRSNWNIHKTIDKDYWNAIMFNYVGNRELSKCLATK